MKQSKLEIKKPYLFYVGNAFPHKNLERLLMAFEIISQKEPDLKLVLVGKIDFFYQRLQKLAKELKIENRTIFAGAVSDEELIELYQNALTYIFPSLTEGFGLPGIEAMTHNCPVVSSSAGPLPEIYGQAAAYFNPTDTQEMAKAILKVIRDQSLQEKLKQEGQRQIKKYSWQKCAKQTLEIYKEILLKQPRAINPD